MKTSLYARIVDSPVLFLCLFVGTCGLALRWQQVQASSTPPSVPSYNWSQHPDTLLISYPPVDCDCTIPPTDWIQAGLNRKLEVLVITSRKHLGLDALKRLSLQQPRVRIVTTVSPEIIKRLSPLGNPTAIWINKGRMIRSSSDTTVPDRFFDKL